MPVELKEKDMPRWATLLNGEVIAIATKSDASKPEINERTAHKYEVQHIGADVRIGMKRGSDGTFAFPNRFQKGAHL
jgi:hypothetical protein